MKLDFKIKYSILNPVIFVLLLWIIHDFENYYRIKFNIFGIYPRSVEGAIGILFSPLIHGDLFHLLSNSFPLLILGTMLYYFYEKIANKTAIFIYLMSGILVWINARASYHIGASGIVYGIASFLFFSGLFRKNRQSLAIALAVIFLYGGLVYGLFPTETSVSYESHIYGALSGLFIAYYYRKVPIWKDIQGNKESGDYAFQKLGTDNIYVPSRMRQNANSIFMIKPLHFGFNAETSETNAFQKNNELVAAADIKTKAIEEFDALTSKILSAKINLIIFDDQHDKNLPDAVFPNNWITLHQDGRIFLYPMAAEVRRLERRMDVMDILSYQHKFRVSKVMDYTAFENSSQFLEGTGSLIFDHINKKCYANISSRTSPELVEKICTDLGYKAVVFKAQDSNGNEIYHTNVMLSVGEHFAVICSEVIPDILQKNTVFDELRSSNKFIIDISENQMINFCANILQVENIYGKKYIIMSSQAYKNFTPEQINIFNMNGSIIHSDLTTIENYGGGSARCMIAEIFLPLF